MILPNEHLILYRKIFQLVIRNCILVFLVFYVLTSCNKQDYGGYYEEAENKHNIKLRYIESVMLQDPATFQDLLDQFDTTGLTAMQSARLNIIQGLNSCYKGDFTECIKMLKSAEVYFINTDNQFHIHLNKLVKAFVFEYLRLNTEAAELYTECDKYFIGDENLSFRFYATLGLLRMSKEISLDTDNFIKIIESQIKKLDEPIYEGLFINTLASIEENDSIKIALLNKATDRFICAKKWSKAYTTELNIFYAKIKQGNYSPEQLYSPLFSSEINYSPTKLQKLQYDYGQACLLSKDTLYNKAIIATENILQQAEVLKIVTIKRDCIKLLSYLYKKVGDYKNSLNMLEKFNNYQTKVSSRKKQIRLLALGAHYKLVQLEKDKLKLKKKVRQTFMVSGAAGLILVFAILAIFFALRESESKQKILELKNTAIEQQFDNVITSLKKEKIANSKLILKIEEINSEYRDSRKIYEFIDQIDKDQITSWVKFETIFMQLKPGWIEKLKQNEPTLTPTDLKYCMCIYFNLNNYKISRLCYVSEDAVKSAKKRLRDKFLLKDSKEIYSYLKSTDHYESELVHD